MSDWIHNLPVPSMALVIFGFTYLLAAGIFAAVSALATEGRAKSFKVISPGMLPVLGILFGLFVAFTAAQVWADNDHASAAVSREASALRAVTLLAAGLPAEQEARLVASVRSYVEQAATVEWPMMAHQTASLRAAPAPLAEALQGVVAMTPTGAGQQTAQREIITALDYCARRAPAADHRQPGRGQCGQMVVSLFASGMRADRDRAGTLRQQARIIHRPGPVRDRRGHVGPADRRA